MPPPSPVGTARTRVRLHSVTTTVRPDSLCEVRVEFEWTGPTLIEGIAEGSDTAQGRMRAGALAALAAAERVTDRSLRLDLRGAKLVRAFDVLLVVVALRGSSSLRRYDLIGSVVAPEGDLARGAVLAVLDATNRIIERYAPSRDPHGPERPDIEP
jgi:hypothetical protein